MAEKDFFVHIDGNGNQIINWSLEQLAADPAPSVGRFFYNTTDGRFKWSDGTNTFAAATLADIAGIGKLVGAFNPAAGTVPTTGSGTAGAIEAGDYWHMSAAGTIVGIVGNDSLEIGDLLIALVDGASAPTDFLGLQVNINMPATVLTTEVVTLASLPANTLTAIPATLSQVRGVTIFNSAGDEIVLEMNSSYQVRSNQALSNLTFHVVGVQ